MSEEAGMFDALEVFGWRYGEAGEVTDTRRQALLDAWGQVQP